MPGRADPGHAGLELQIGLEGHTRRRWHRFGPGRRDPHIHAPARLGDGLAQHQAAALVGEAAAINLDVIKAGKGRQALQIIQLLPGAGCIDQAGAARQGVLLRQWRRTQDQGRAQTRR